MLNDYDIGAASRHQTPSHCAEVDPIVSPLEPAPYSDPSPRDFAYENTSTCARTPKFKSLQGDGDMGEVLHPVRTDEKGITGGQTLETCSNSGCADRADSVGDEYDLFTERARKG